MGFVLQMGGASRVVPETKMLCLKQGLGRMELWSDRFVGWMVRGGRRGRLARVLFWVITGGEGEAEGRMGVAVLGRGGRGRREEKRR